MQRERPQHTAPAPALAYLHRALSRTMRSLSSRISIPLTEPIRERADEQTSELEAPSQSASEPEIEPDAPQERQNSGILRPTPQRVGTHHVGPMHAAAVHHSAWMQLKINASSLPAIHHSNSPLDIALITKRALLKLAWTA